MAKVKHPLHSISASGSIGGALSFQQHRTRSVVTSKPRSYAANTAAQLENQQRMRDAKIAYDALNAQEKIWWNDLAIKYGRSAWACFFAEYQYQQVEAPGAPLIPEVNL